MFKQRSKLLALNVVLEVLLSIWALFYFNYMDRLSYAETLIKTPTDLALLIENMYTNTWWALIILAVCLITIFALVAFIYKDIKFQFMSICLWIILFILAIDFKDSLANIISTIAIFIPIFILNIFSYFNQKRIIKK